MRRHPVVLILAIAITIATTISVSASVEAGPGDIGPVGAKKKKKDRSMLRIALKSTVLSGAKDATAFNRVVRRDHGALKRCLVVERNRGWFGGGKVIFKVSVGADGKVSDVDTAASPGGFKGSACMSRRLSRLQLPSGTKRLFRLAIEIAQPANAPKAAPPAPKLANIAAGALIEARAAKKEARCLERAAKKLTRAARAVRRKETPKREKRLTEALHALRACRGMNAILRGVGDSLKPAPGVIDNCPGCKVSDGVHRQ